MTSAGKYFTESSKNQRHGCCTRAGREFTSRVLRVKAHMKNLKSSVAASLLIVGGLILSLCVSGVGTSSVSAGSNTTQRVSSVSRGKDEKISDTLRGRDANSEIVQVIVQLNSSPTGSLNALMQASGEHIKDDIKEFNSLVVELPLTVVSELADFSEVEFISADRDVHRTGHVKRTTGAAFMRTQS